MTPAEKTGGVPDVIVIAGDTPHEVLGKEEREQARLTVDGCPATLGFLRAYFAAGRDARAAAAHLREQGLRFVSLNGPYLAQVLAAHDFSTRLIGFFTPQREEVAALLRAGARTVVISTTFLPFAKQIDAIAAFVKGVAPQATVIAGGIQVWKSLRHRRLLEAGVITGELRAAVSAHNYFMDPVRPTPVDLFIVSDSGEHTLVQVLERLRAGREAGDLPNTARYRDGAWHLNPLVPEPAGEVRMDWSRHFRAPTDAYVPVQAGLGCGFRCTFCDFSGLRPVRTRTARSIVEEIRTIPPFEGRRRVYFTDDNLFPNKRRAREVCRALIDADLSMRWRGLIRVSVVDDEVAALMARSGCLEVLLGIESGDAGMLRRMHKRVTPEQILAGVAALARHGISTKSTFIVGFPGETASSIRNTVDLLNAYPTDGPAVHRYLFFQFAVLPLAEVASAASRARYGLRGYGYEWRHDTMDARGAAEALLRLQDDLKLELSPSYVQEIPELDGLSIDRIKRIYVLRNRLARLGRGLEPGGAAAEAALWAELEQAFRRS